MSISSFEENKQRSKMEHLEIESPHGNDVETLGLITTVMHEGETEDPKDDTSSKLYWISSCIIFVLLGLTAYLYTGKTDKIDLSSMFPSELLAKAYNSHDFSNDAKNTPPYWNDVKKHKKKKEDDENSDAIIPHIGPCYLPKSEPNWSELIEQNQNIVSENDIKYTQVSTRFGEKGKDEDDISGLCRPGFIIIGAGKCGTSSLYHYLVDHPRALPAKNKQIHYFKYFTSRPMKWYLSNFPPAESFLSSGALITGEASPGYLPYPDVAHRLKNWMQNQAGNGEGQTLVNPKIITIVRNPLERSWSSYKYNYREPLIDRLRRQDLRRKINRTDEWYRENRVFSFDELIAAEINQLKKCLAPGGEGEMGAKQLYGKQDWAVPEFERRTREELPPLVTIDESCYGQKVSKSVPRRQWEDLVQQYPDKVINVGNLHLVQSLVGRSLYTLPLEWWYAMFPQKDLYLFCNEELRYHPSESMSDLGRWLGLPAFNFTNVTSAGMYNVDGHTGYDTISQWKASSYIPDDIPISKSLREEYERFVKPFNDRLFKLAGKRCGW